MSESFIFFFFMLRRQPNPPLLYSSPASDVFKDQPHPLPFIFFCPSLKCFSSRGKALPVLMEAGSFTHFPTQEDKGKHRLRFLVGKKKKKKKIQQQKKKKTTTKNTKNKTHLLYDLVPLASIKLLATTQVNN